MFHILQLKDGRKNNMFLNGGDYIMKNFLKAAGQFGLWGLFIASSAVVGVSLYDLKHEIEYRKLMKKVKETQKTIDNLTEHIQQTESKSNGVN